MFRTSISVFAILVCSWLAAACTAQSTPEAQDLSWLTAEERAFLVQHKRIRLAPTPHYPPFEYWDDGDPVDPTDDRFRGVVSSYLNHFEKTLGIQFELVRTKTWAENLAKLQSREIDAVSLIVPWTDRDYVAVSKPYISYPAVIIVRKDMAESNLHLRDFVGKKVAVPDNYIGEAFLRQNYPGIQVVEVEDTDEGLHLLSGGDVQAFFDGAAAVAHVAERAGISNLRIGGESDFQYNNGFGIRSDWKIFAGIISKTLDRIPDGQKSAFHRQWVIKGFLQKRFYEYPRFWWILGTVVTALTLGSIAMVVWNRRQAAFIEQLEAEKRRTEAARVEAEEANRGKSQFVAMISHEIRTPMNGVLGMCELLRSTKLGPQQQEYLSSATGSAENLVALVNDILDFSKMEAGKLELEREPFSLERTVNSVSTLMRSQASRKGLTLSVHQADDLSPAYLGDALRIRQVLLNLLSNAIKFTERGGIEVRVFKKPDDRAGHLVVFEVQDSGIGIAPEKVDEVFKPFEQESSSTTRHYGGTGLGLSICRMLAEMMGGSADATSVVGKGSVFRFSALLEPTKLTPADQEDGKIGEVAASRIKVLLAEDSVVNQKVATGLLEKRGHCVEVVTTGTEAVEAAQSGEYQVLLMDIEMPEMDGLTAVKKIRRREERTGRHQRVIAMTGHAMTGDRERFLAAGMDGHLVKPYKPAELYAAVEVGIETAIESATTGAMSRRKTDSAEFKSSPDLDWEAALETTGGDGELAKVLLDACLVESPKILARAREAVIDSDFVTARRCGHSLRSSLAAVGAVNAAAATQQLEFCQSEIADDYLSAIEAIEQQFKKVATLAGDLKSG